MIRGLPDVHTTSMNNVDLDGMFAYRTTRISSWFSGSVTINMYFATSDSVKFSPWRRLAQINTDLELCRVALREKGAMPQTLWDMTEVPKSMSTSSSFTSPTHTGIFRSPFRSCSCVTSSSCNGFLLGVCDRVTLGRMRAGDDGATIDFERRFGSAPVWKIIQTATRIWLPTMNVAYSL